MSKAALEAIKKKFSSELLSEHAQHGDETLVVKKEKLVQIAEFSRDDAELAFDVLVDLTVVDYLIEGRTPRFEVVLHLRSTSKKHRLRLKVPLEEGAPKVPSVVGVWKSATWMEREAYDMYGVVFEGHPDLRRILLYPEFEGHPLRKDYPMARRQPLYRRPERQGDVWEQKHILSGPAAGDHFKGTYDLDR
ncbi:MAG: NADH-quinone oxidoreductase subunit C [Polyangia bacterium]|jgi:NADH-quinone oxidoreductase subunit C|nr:NADH-quinone oxidoreductase subunit C [Polyangia bacterium]